MFQKYKDIEYEIEQNVYFRPNILGSSIINHFYKIYRHLSVKFSI